MTSKIEQAIINSRNPIQISSNEIIDVNGIKGILANKSEFAHIQDIDKYELHNDSNPQIIKKQPGCCVNQRQEVSVKYLKSNRPMPEVGRLIIRQEPDILLPAAPPLVLRQINESQNAPSRPIIIRESPPKTPQPIPEKIITIPGKTVTPPRKLVIEKLPTLPAKPQEVIIEKWLPFEKIKRKVVFEKSESVQTCPPKNVVIEWEAPCIEVTKEIKNLGTICADPDEYRRKYKFSKKIDELPAFVRELEKEGIEFRANHEDYMPELEGDLEALKLIDLDKEGLGHYKSLLGLNSSNSKSGSASFGSDSDWCKQQSGSVSIPQKQACAFDSNIFGSSSVSASIPESLAIETVPLLYTRSAHNSASVLASIPSVSISSHFENIPLASFSISS